MHPLATTSTGYLYSSTPKESSQAIIKPTSPKQFPSQLLYSGPKGGTGGVLFSALQPNIFSQKLQTSPSFCPRKYFLNFRYQSLTQSQAVGYKFASLTSILCKYSMMRNEVPKNHLESVYLYRLRYISPIYWLCVLIAVLSSNMSLASAWIGGYWSKYASDLKT